MEWVVAPWFCASWLSAAHFWVQPPGCAWARAGRAAATRPASAISTTGRRRVRTICREDSAIQAGIGESAKNIMGQPLPDRSDQEDRAGYHDHAAARARARHGLDRIRDRLGAQSERVGQR